MQRRLGLIGSLEMHNLWLLADAQSAVVETLYGDVEVMIGKIGETAVVQMTRGTRGLAAHAVNHRANMAAFLRLGVTDVVATAMVGSLRSSLPVGTLLLLDQFLDFTKHCQWAFYEDDEFRDFDFTEPFCSRLRLALLQVALKQSIDLIPHACYVGVDGPRFETSAEVRMFTQLGGDVIGMTIIPECIMAREAGLCYAVLAGVVNAGAGISLRPLAAKDFLAPRARHMEQIMLLIHALVESFATETVSAIDSCQCVEASGQYRRPEIVPR